MEPIGEVSFVDVPGHERFLKNMLAGIERSMSPCSSSPPTRAGCPNPRSISRCSTSSASIRASSP